VRALVAWDRVELMRRAMMLCYFVGYAVGTRQIERETKRTFYSPATDKR